MGKKLFSKESDFGFPQSILSHCMVPVNRNGGVMLTWSPIVTWFFGLLRVFNQFFKFSAVCGSPGVSSAHPLSHIIQNSLGQMTETCLGQTTIIGLVRKIKFMGLKTCPKGCPMFLNPGGYGIKDSGS